LDIASPKQATAAHEACGLEWEHAYVLYEYRQILGNFCI